MYYMSDHEDGHDSYRAISTISTLVTTAQRTCGCRLATIAMPMPVPPMPVLINEFSEIQYLRDSLRERDAEITRLIEQLAMRDTPSTAEPIEFTHYQTDDNQKLSTLEDAINYAADLNKPMIVYGAVEVGRFELVTISRWVPLSA